MSAKKAKDVPNPAGCEGKPLSLAPMITEEALRKLLAAKPETLEELKTSPKTAKKTKKPVKPGTKTA